MTASAEGAVRPPALPPIARSRAALGLAAAAAEGRFALQACASCGTMQYPPRDACRRCLSVDLRWQDVPRGGSLLAETTVRASASLAFQGLTPRVGTVALDAGPRVVAFVHRAVPRGGRVRMEIRLDRAGGPVLFAFPDRPNPAPAEEDPMAAATAADPRGRHILLTNARSPDAPALASAFRDAGAAEILVGEAEAGGPNPNHAALRDAGARIVPLDVSDEGSARRLATTTPVDILVNNARLVRPGGIGSGAALARDLLEVNALGLVRLAEAFGPVLRAAAARGPGIPAFVGIVSVDALAPPLGRAAFAASEAAALSLMAALRAELSTGGVRVVSVLVGPTDDPSHADIPPPKLTPAALARAVVDGLRQGLEDVVAGDVARETVERWRRSPTRLTREHARSS